MAASAGLGETAGLTLPGRRSPGKAHSPRIGDRDEWIKRASKGLDGLVLGATRGHDGMPARGGRPDLTDAEFKAAIFYMFTKSVSAPDKK